MPVAAYHCDIDAVIFNIIGEQGFGRSKSGDRPDVLLERVAPETAIFQKLGQFRFFFRRLAREVAIIQQVGIRIIESVKEGKRGPGEKRGCNTYCLDRKSTRLNSSH